MHLHEQIWQCPQDLSWKDAVCRKLIGLGGRRRCSEMPTWSVCKDSLKYRQKWTPKEKSPQKEWGTRHKVRKVARSREFTLGTVHKGWRSFLRTSTGNEACAFFFCLVLKNVLKVQILRGWSTAWQEDVSLGAVQQPGILTSNDDRVHVGGSLQAGTTQLFGRHLEKGPEALRLSAPFGFCLDSEGWWQLLSGREKTDTNSISWVFCRDFWPQNIH